MDPDGRAKPPALGPPPGDGSPPATTHTSAPRAYYSPKYVEGAFSELRLYGVLRSRRRKLPQILHLSDAPSTPLWCHGGRRYISHKVEASNPALRKTGTQQGQGSQWCDRLPAIPHKVGEEGVVVGMWYPTPT